MEVAKVVKMPVLGQSVEEVRILQWFKSVGDSVAVGEKVAEIETDKTNMDFESTEAGIIRQILAEADSYVKVEAPVLIVGTADEPIEGEMALPSPSLPPTTVGEEDLDATEGTVSPVPDSISSSPAPPLRDQGAGKIGAISPRALRLVSELGVETGQLAGRGTGPGGRVVEKDVQILHAELEEAAQAVLVMGGLAKKRGVGQGESTDVPTRAKASPLARAVAEGAGLDLSQVAGTGSGGRIVAGDVHGASVSIPVLPEALTPTPTRAEGGKRTVTLTGLRKRVADNLVRSIRNAPHVTLHLTADMTEAMRLRGEILPGLEKAIGIRLSPTDIIVKACAVALREHPYLNAHIDGDTITLFDDVNVGLAVSLGDEGLIVPVIKNVGAKGFGQIVRDRDELVKKARAGKLAPTDIQGGTFTVTNLGNYGIDAFNPIIPPPQVAILGVGAIADQVVARGGAPVVRPMMGLSLSFDHRALDGAPAAAFLARVKEILESPYLLLL